MAELPEDPEVTASLRVGLQALQLGGNAELEQRLLDYARLLQRWNQRYGLSGTHKLSELITRHVLDSLTLHPYLGVFCRWLDVGSGAGLPGVPLALASVAQRFTLLERSLNKARFLRQVKLELGIDHLSVVHTELQHYEPQSLPEGILARAVMPLAKLLPCLRHLCRRGTRVLVPQGRYPAAALATLPDYFRLLDCPRIVLRELSVERYLVILEGRGRENGG